MLDRSVLPPNKNPGSQKRTNIMFAAYPAFPIETNFPVVTTLNLEKQWGKNKKSQSVIGQWE